jgi:hypothetical protein
MVWVRTGAFGTGSLRVVGKSEQPVRKMGIHNAAIDARRPEARGRVGFIGHLPF